LWVLWQTALRKPEQNVVEQALATKHAVR
jgi:hypothetical protein